MRVFKEDRPEASYLMVPLTATSEIPPTLFFKGAVYIFEFLDFRGDDLKEVAVYKMEPVAWEYENEPQNHGTKGMVP